MTDTVGFIRKLPPHLVASFRATHKRQRRSRCEQVACLARQVWLDVNAVKAVRAFCRGKIASYKMLYEEPPLPLYTFKNGTSWIAGCFARLDDFEEASLFFYSRLKQEPPSGFVRYSASRLGDTDFSKRIDEHGSIYVKVVHLKEKHPLVEFK